MRMGILGKKVGMTQIFDESGAVVPVTVVDTSECFVSEVKTKGKHGYNALQVAAGFRKPQNVNKARAGHFKKAGVAAKAITKEIRLDDADNIEHMKPGQTLTPTMFAKGDIVDIIGLSKGRGFTGVIKRHGFHGADASHGVHEYFRHGGSNGTNTFPGKTLKNKGMPGQMGATKTTQQSSQIVEVRAEENLILIRGAVPGFRNRYVMIRMGKKSKPVKDRAWVVA